MIPKLSKNAVTVVAVLECVVIAALVTRLEWSRRTMPQSVIELASQRIVSLRGHHDLKWLNGLLYHELATAIEPIIRDASSAVIQEIAETSLRNVVRWSDAADEVTFWVCCEELAERHDITRLVAIRRVVGADIGHGTALDELVAQCSAEAHKGSGLK